MRETLSLYYALGYKSEKEGNEEPVDTTTPYGYAFEHGRQVAMEESAHKVREKELKLMELQYPDLDAYDWEDLPSYDETYYGDCP